MSGPDWWSERSGGSAEAQAALWQLEFDASPVFSDMQGKSPEQRRPQRPRRPPPKRPTPPRSPSISKLDELRDQVVLLFREVHALKAANVEHGPTDVVDTETAARIAGRTPATIRRWVKDGRIRPLQSPPYHRGTRYTFRVSDVERARDRSTAAEVVIDLEERAAAIRKRRRG